MKRSHVVPHNAKEVLVAFTDDNGEGLTNVTVIHPPLAVRFRENRLDMEKLDGDHQHQVTELEKAFAEGAAALERKYHEEAKALAKKRDDAIAAAQKQHKGAAALIQKAKDKLDADAFKLAETEIARRAKEAAGVQ